MYFNLVSQATSIVGIIVHALGTTFPAFYASLVLFCFWSFGPTGTRSSLMNIKQVTWHGTVLHPNSYLPILYCSWGQNAHCATTSNFLPVPTLFIIHHQLFSTRMVMTLTTFFALFARLNMLYSCFSVDRNGQGRRK